MLRKIRKIDFPRFRVRQNRRQDLAASESKTFDQRFVKPIKIRLVEGFLENSLKISISFVFLLIFGFSILAQVTSDVPAVSPSGIVDLRTTDGANLVKAIWKYGDVKITEAENRKPGDDLRASGEPTKTNDINFRAGAADFNDSNWETITPESLENRRGNGKLSFNWYRTKITIPERIGNFETKGTTVVFEIVVDDYSEIYVNGKSPVVLGQTGGGLVKGFKAPNRVF